MKPPLRRLSEREVNYYCNRSTTAREVRSFAALAPCRQEVDGLIAFAKHYITSRRLDLLQTHTVWMMVRRMQVSASEPFKEPTVFPDVQQLPLVDSGKALSPALVSMSCRAILKSLIDHKGMTVRDIALSLDIPAATVAHILNEPRVNLPQSVRLRLLRLYHDRPAVTGMSV